MQEVEISLLSTGVETQPKCWLGFQHCFVCNRFTYPHLLHPPGQDSSLPCYKRPWTSAFYRGLCLVLYFWNKCQHHLVLSFLASLEFLHLWSCPALRVL